MKCQDCNGSGNYQGFNTLPEPCQRCAGTGIEGGKSRLERGREIARKALKSVVASQPHNDLTQEEIDALLELPIEVFEYAEKCDTVTELNKAPRSSGMGGMLPELKMGDIIHVFDADWYEAEITGILLNVGTPPQTIIRADAPCDTFRICRSMLTFNVTLHRWEFIKAGTPVY